MKYTKEDVIMCESKAHELGLKVGMEVAVGNNLLACFTNASQGFFKKLVEIDFDEDYPFIVSLGSIRDGNLFCIIKKEPEVKYIPYDLSKKEDRDELRGKWVRNNEWEDEYLIDCFISAKNNGEGRWVIGGYYDGHDLLTKFTFVDTGLPVGKPVEEVEE